MARDPAKLAELVRLGIASHRKPQKVAAYKALAELERLLKPPPKIRQPKVEGGSRPKPPPRAKPKPKPPARPVAARSPWQGVTVFTAHDPHVALPWLKQEDTIVLKADGGDRSSPEVAERLRGLGLRVVEWRSWDEPQGWPLAPSTIGQAEGPGQRATCEREAVEAVVTNVTFDASDWLRRYQAVFTECYENVNPQATQAAMEYEAVKRGAKLVIPCYAVYDGASERPGGRKVPLSEYLSKHTGPSFAIYMAEYCDPADVAALEAWRKKQM